MAGGVEMTIDRRMKRYVIGAAVLIFVGAGPGFAQAPVADYGARKEKVLRETEHRQRSELISQVSRTYREMVSSFKAKSVEHGEEMSLELSRLLEDPLLPAEFAARIRHKQARFLDRVYGRQTQALLDFPVDDELRDEEVQAIQARLDGPRPQSPVASALVTPADPMGDEAKGFEDGDVRQRERAERREEKRRVREADRREVRHQKEAARLARAAERAAKKTARKAERDQTRQKKRLGEASSAAQTDQAEQELDAYLAETRSAHRAADQKLTEIETKMMENRQAVVDEFVRKYRSELMARRKDLKAKFDDQLEALYEDGVALYKNKAYRKAWDILSEVERIQPDYKKTRSYLASIEPFIRIDTVDQKRHLVDSVLDSFDQAITPSVDEQGGRSNESD